MGRRSGDTVRHDSILGPSEDPGAPARESSTTLPRPLPLTAAVLLGLLSVPTIWFLILIAGLAGAQVLSDSAAIATAGVAAFMLMMLVSHATAKLIQSGVRGLGSLMALGLALNMALVPALSGLAGLGALAILEACLRPYTYFNGSLLGDLVSAGVPLVAASGMAAILGVGVSRGCRLGASGRGSIRLAILAATGWALVLVGTLVVRRMLVLLLAPLLLAWLGVRQIAVLKRIGQDLKQGPTDPSLAMTRPAADEVEGSGRDRGSLARRAGGVLFFLGVAVVCGYAGLLIGLEASRAQQARDQAAERTARVIFAAQDIPLGELITMDMVIPVPYPPDLFVETMTISLEQVLGKEARYDIARGMPITEGMLGPAPIPTLPVEVGLGW
jgi:hypothetical protein